MRKKENSKFSSDQEEMLQALSDTINYLDGTTDEKAGLSDMLMNIIGYLKNQWNKKTFIVSCNSENGLFVSKPFNSEEEAKAYTIADIRDFLLKRCNGYSGEPNPSNDSLFNWAIEKGYLEDDPREMSTIIVDAAYFREYRITEITENNSPGSSDTPEISVPTSAGVLKAYPCTDPDQPGISVMLQPAGFENEIDAAFVSVYENPEFAREGERPVDVAIMCYGDARTEDYTHKEVIKRESILEGLGE